MVKFTCLNCHHCTPIYNDKGKQVAIHCTKDQCRSWDIKVAKESRCCHWRR